MTLEDKNEIERLLNLKVASFKDKDSAQAITQRYINPGAKYCMTCDPAVRQMFKILREWWNKQNKAAYKFIKTK